MHRRSWHGITSPFFLTFCLHIYFQYNFFISLLFHFFFLILTCSCPYSYNHMLTATYICRPNIYINYPQARNSANVQKSYTCSLRLHLMHLISVMSFKQEHVSIPKRRTFSPLFLFCAYDTSVLQNFKIFIHLLFGFSHGTLLWTEIELKSSASQLRI